MKHTPFGLQIQENDPLYHDPRFQRRVVSWYRPIPIVENMYDVTLACGHAPLFFAKAEPEIGSLLFCTGCYETRNLN